MLTRTRACSEYQHEPLSNLATNGHPATNTKRQQIAIAVISIALSFGPLKIKLLGLLAQSLIESLFVCLLV